MVIRGDLADHHGSPSSEMGVLLKLKNTVKAESRLQHIDIVGTTAVGRQGLGSTKSKSWSKAGNTEKRDMIQEEIRMVEEEERRAKAVTMDAQGAWTQWTTANRKLTLADIWQYEPLRLAFLLRSVYELLPSPANLHRWGLKNDPKCTLCDKTESMEHVLSTCSPSLTQGRYRWRHDCVLCDIADILEKERTKKRKKQNPRTIQFVKEGRCTPNHKHSVKQFLKSEKVAVLPHPPYPRATFSCFLNL